ncbi:MULTISPECIES: response regulator [Flammeovirga]|uniref:Response regulator n=1 Tax=Flammeovirga aprica JL-4 TaxID=694437 RepID=A0A7X9RUE2_9BACT|nr:MULTISPECIES: response regulator [Flammeovirga]MBD0402420.1 response regulator [Flammeovirga sp. EKP202]NME68896.1 response regulator [Flammeovirga aprica JL-4]
MAKKVLIVDDSLYMRSIIKDALEEAGFEVIGQASNGEEAIDLALDSEPDLITLDNILPDMLGLDILKTLKEEDLTSKIIMISAVGQQAVIDEGMNLGLDSYLVKPFTPEQLTEAIGQII